MKIAVASEGKMTAGHFGHCEQFNIYDVEGGRIMKEVAIPNPGHKPGFLPNYLYDLGVNVIISGGMGGGAVAIFNEKGIEVIMGAIGEARQNVLAYIEGNLESRGSVCHEHQHAHECGRE